MTEYASPEEVEAAFYAAFEARDADAMMRVWAADDDIVCVHPLGPVLKGRAAIASSWREIFRDAGPVRFALSGRVSSHGKALAVRLVHENIHHGAAYTQLSVVIATNVYARRGRGWAMIAHHASPAPALAREPEPTQAVH